MRIADYHSKVPKETYSSHTFLALCAEVLMISSGTSLLGKIFEGRRNASLVVGNPGKGKPYLDSA